MTSQEQMTSVTGDGIEPVKHGDPYSQLSHFLQKDTMDEGIENCQREPGINRNAFPCHSPCVGLSGQPRPFPSHTHASIVLKCLNSTEMPQ